MSYFTKWHRPIRRFCIPCLALALVVLLLVASCKDKGVEPQQGPEDYKVYFAEFQRSGPSTLFAFHPTTQQIDSVVMPWNVQTGVVVSADGSRLYIGNRTQVVVADARSLSKIAELPYASRWPVAVSPDNSLVAITGDDLTILRTSDYSVVFSDTDRTWFGCFSSDSKTFFCSTDGADLVYRVSLSDTNHPVTRKRFNDGGAHQVIPSCDGRKWFLYLFHGDYSVFEVYNVEADSIVFGKAFAPGDGRLAVMPNESRLFYTNPGNMGSLISPPLNFTIFDVQQNAISKVIYDTSMFTIGGYYYPPNEMAVTPDNRWLILRGGDTDAGVIYLYDIEHDSLTYRQDWGGIPRSLTGPSVQIQP
jgi:hypothetical protein